MEEFEYLEYYKIVYNIDDNEFDALINSISIAEQDGEFEIGGIDTWN